MNTYDDTPLLLHRTDVLYIKVVPINKSHFLNGATIYARIRCSLTIKSMCDKIKFI